MFPLVLEDTTERESQIIMSVFYRREDHGHGSVLLLTFQIFQIFQEMKYFFLCFSTSWKMVFYGIQIFEKLFSILFRFWKENFYAFHLLEKVIFMVFSLHFRVLKFVFFFVWDMLISFDSISSINIETKMTLQKLFSMSQTKQKYILRP